MPQLILSGDNHVFADAPDLTPAIQIARKTPPTDGYTAQAAVFTRGENIQSFKEFRQEVVKVFKRDIALKDRDDWEELLKARRTEIARLTEEIVRLETELNAEVYAAFELNDEEIRLIEEETKYQYGE